MNRTFEIEHPRCPICHDAFAKAGENAVVLSTCGHVYCQACADTQVGATKECAMCRTAATSHDIMRLFVDFGPQEIYASPRISSENEQGEGTCLDDEPLEDGTKLMVIPKTRTLTEKGLHVIKRLNKLVETDPSTWSTSSESPNDKKSAFIQAGKYVREVCKVSRGNEGIISVFKKLADALIRLQKWYWNVLCLAENLERSRNNEKSYRTRIESVMRAHEEELLLKEAKSNEWKKKSEEREEDLIRKMATMLETMEAEREESQQLQRKSSLAAGELVRLKAKAIQFEKKYLNKKQECSQLKRMNEKLAKKTLLDSDEDGSDSSSLVVDDADAENLSHDTPPTSSYNHPSSSTDMIVVRPTVSTGKLDWQRTDDGLSAQADILFGSSLQQPKAARLVNKSRRSNGSTTVQPASAPVRTRAKLETTQNIPSSLTRQASLLRIPTMPVPSRQQNMLSNSKKKQRLTLDFLND